MEGDILYSVDWKVKIKYGILESATVVWFGD